LQPALVPLWPDAAAALGVGRTKAFELVATGELRSVRLGRKRMVPASAIPEYVDRLVAEQSGPTQAA
jgi:excisionase family DNA binding protein